MSQAPSDLPSLPEQIVIFLQSPLHHAVLSPARFFGSFTRIGWPLSFTTLRRICSTCYLTTCPHTRFAGQKNNLYNGKG